MRQSAFVLVLCSSHKRNALKAIYRFKGGKRYISCMCKVRLSFFEIKLKIISWNSARWPNSMFIPVWLTLTHFKCHESEADMVFFAAWNVSPLRIYSFSVLVGQSDESALCSKKFDTDMHRHAFWQTLCLKMKYGLERMTLVVMKQIFFWKKKRSDFDFSSHFSFDRFICLWIRCVLVCLIVLCPAFCYCFLYVFVHDNHKNISCVRAVLSVNMSWNLNVILPHDNIFCLHFDVLKFW